MKKWVEFSLLSFGTLTFHCVVRTIEMFNFVPLRNNSVTTGFSFLLSIISSYHQKLFIFCDFYLYCILQYFHKHVTYRFSIQ